MREEFDALGIDDLYERRGAVTDEFMAVCIDLWTQDGPSSFDGRWVRYRDVGANPRPVQRPHIPIWVGGKTPAAHRRVARYGSGYHTVGSTPQQVAAEVAAVRADPDDLVVSMLWAFLAAEGVQQVIDAIGAYAEAGLHHLVGVPSLTDRQPSDDHERLEATIEDMQRFAQEVLPAVR
jgi:alkanesulfonate monooxygenase SsuD/methylene tetrahydromethanopterin reductase-like flavin-dependent oxidoreductase (luciferase family)